MKYDSDEYDWRRRLRGGGSSDYSPIGVGPITVDLLALRAKTLNGISKNWIFISKIPFNPMF